MHLQVTVAQRQPDLIVILGSILGGVTNRISLDILFLEAGSSEYCHSQILNLRVVSHHLSMCLRKVYSKDNVYLVCCIRLHCCPVFLHTGCEAEQNQKYIYKLFHNPSKLIFVTSPSSQWLYLFRTPVPLVVYATGPYIIIRAIDCVLPIVRCGSICIYEFKVS